MAPSRENILERIRRALADREPMPFPDEDLQGDVYKAETGTPDVLFARRFTAIGGRFVYAESEREAVEALAAIAREKKWSTVCCPDEALRRRFAGFDACAVTAELAGADAGLSTCEALVARTGSILLSSAQTLGRTLPVYPPAQVVLATPSDLVADIADGLARVRARYGDEPPSMVNLASGPSRTADIEKTLVLGAHGPGEVYVLLVEAG